MINYETILSNYDDKLTLMQWLKKVEEALKDASAVSFNVNKRGNATLTFSVVFEDGSELETGPIVLEQGESVTSAAIENGHLLLTLTNGDVLDAGDLGGVSSFSIDASQHLIVHYQNGTTQDLGAIFQGNVNISGNLNVTGSINGEASPSVKPIYYHGIDMNSASFNQLITITILDNSPTRYTGERLVEWITNIVNQTGGLLLACNGNVRDFVDLDGNTRSGHVVAIFTNTASLALDQMTITLVSDTGVKTVFSTTFTAFFGVFSAVGDKVNKIN